MHVTTSSDRNSISLKLSGRLDFNARHSIKPAIQECYDSNKPHIIFDLKDVTFIDSAGIGLLHRCITETKELKTTVTFTNPKQQVHDILELCSMAEYISSPASSQEPLASTSTGSNTNVLTREALSHIE